MNQLSPRKIKCTKFTQLVGTNSETGDLQLCSALLFPLWKCRFYLNPVLSFWRQIVQMIVWSMFKIWLTFVIRKNSLNSHLFMKMTTKRENNNYWCQPLVISLKNGSANIFLKGHIVNIFGLWATLSLATTRLWHSLKAPVDST